MRDGAKYLVGALAGAVLTAAGFLLSASAPTTPHDGVRPDAPAEATAASDARGSSPGPGARTDSPAPGLEGSRKAPSLDEAAYLEKSLRAERARRADAVIRPTDTGLEILRRFHEAQADLSEVLGDYDRFSSHVVHAEGKSVAWKGGDGVTKVSRDEAKGVVVLEFGPGTFLLERGRGGWGDFREGVKALEIRGAGMDATTVRYDNNLLYAAKGIENLRMSGLTWEYADSNWVLSTRGDVALACEDVRFRGAPGASNAPFYLEAYTYLGFRRCVFESAGSGAAVRIRGDVVALFKECAFRDLRSVVYADAGTSREGSIRFEDCEFEGSMLADPWAFEYRGQPAFPIVVLRGRVSFGGATLADARRRADWGVSLATSVDGTVFGPDPNLPTVSDLLDVLAGVARDTRLVPMELHLKLPGRGTRPASYEVAVWDAAAKKSVAFLAAFDAAGVHVTANPGGPTYGLTEARVAASKSLLEILSAAGVPRSAPARGVHLYDWWVGSKSVLAVHLESDDWPGWMIDAATGEVLTRPEPSATK